MLAEDFQKFYNPFYYDSELTITPVIDATVDQARVCNKTVYFDNDVVENLPLKELVEKSILDLPKDFTFVAMGAEADPLEKFFRIIIPKFRSDIRFIKPDRDMTKEYIDYATTEYFAAHPASVHALATLDRLIKEGIPAGRLGPFIRGKKPLGEWLIMDSGATIPFYRHSIKTIKASNGMIVPNFTLPFSRAFIRNLRLPTSRIPLIMFGPVVLMSILMKEIMGEDISLQQHILDGDDWNWYPGLVNRNWVPTDYHRIEEFL